jgi:hypothetical protein
LSLKIPHCRSETWTEQSALSRDRYRLDVALEQLLTGLWVFWLVHLRLESGEDSWFEYVKLNIRPR